MRTYSIAARRGDSAVNATPNLSARHALGERTTQLGVALLLIGAVVGWGGLALRQAAIDLPGQDYLLTPLAGLSSINVGAFLGAELTTLAAIITIVIWFNASLLQVAGRSVALALMRAILFSIAPYLLCWGATTSVALAYLLSPPVYLGQIWQLFIWFASIVLLMLGYLLTVPWRLSGEYAASWALGDLRRQPIAKWETAEGYSVIQTSFNSATEFGDLGAARALALLAGSFLTGTVDVRAERENRFTSERFRALKNLVTGCVLKAASAPTQVAYYVGILCAGTFLQGVSVHASADNKGRGLFSGVLRALRDGPERLSPFWSGFRHALCKGDLQGEPYLIRFWRAHARWDPSDPRLVEDVAAGLLQLHAAVWHAAQAPRGATQRSQQDGGAPSRIEAGRGASHLAGLRDDDDDTMDATSMLVHLYGNIGSLGEAVQTARLRDDAPIWEYPLRLLNALHERATEDWQSSMGISLRSDELAKAYTLQRSRLEALRESGEAARGLVPDTAHSRRAR